MHDSIRGTQNEAPILRETYLHHLDNTTTVVLQKDKLIQNKVTC